MTLKYRLNNDPARRKKSEVHYNTPPSIMTLKVLGLPASKGTVFSNSKDNEIDLQNGAELSSLYILKIVRCLAQGM